MTSPATTRYQALVVDAGVGNLGNLKRAMRLLGAACEITHDPARVASGRCLLLPGVGAFRPPRENLRGELEQALRHSLSEGGWLLGICVGYQLLFHTSEEFGTTDGLGLLEGRVTALPREVPLPHIGWNRLHDLARHPLFAGIPAGGYAYFVHSYAPEGVPRHHSLGLCTHGRTFAAVVGRERVFGTQFHPEKSGALGLRLLTNFLEMAHGSPPGCPPEINGTDTGP